MNIKEIAKQYIICALWTNEIDDEGITYDDVAPESIDIVELKVTEFLDKVNKLLPKDWSIGWDVNDESGNDIGHNLWLTRSGQGSGFCDRDLPYAKELANICTTDRFHGDVYVEHNVVYIEE